MRLLVHTISGDDKFLFFPPFLRLCCGSLTSSLRYQMSGLFLLTQSLIFPFPATQEIFQKFRILQISSTAAADATLVLTRKREKRHATWYFFDFFFKDFFSALPSPIQAASRVARWSWFDANLVRNSSKTFVN